MQIRPANFFRGATLVAHMVHRDESQGVGALIRRLREERGLTQGQLATYARVSRAWLSRVEIDSIKRPDREKLERVAQALRVPPETLLSAAGYRVGPPPPVQRTRTPQEILKELERVTPILVPETTQPASAGPGAYAESEYWPYWPGPGERGHEFIAVPVTGDCLEPYIRSGERVIVDKSAVPRPGDIVVAVHEGEVVVKILRQRNGRLYLEAVRGQPPILVGEETTIIGVVRMAMHRPRVPES